MEDGPWTGRLMPGPMLACQWGAVAGQAGFLEEQIHDLSQNTQGLLES